MKQNIAKSTLGAAAVLSTMLAFGATANAGSSDGLHGWVNSASTTIEKGMKYPKMAIVRGEEGTASFRITVNSAGNVVKAEKHGYGSSPLINAAARSALKRTKFPALPSGLDKDELTFSLQLTYAIAGSAAEERALKREGYVTGREVAKARSPMFASIRIEEETASE